MRLERLSKTEKAAKALGRVYGLAKFKLQKAGGKAKEVAKKNAPVVKSAAKTGFLAGLAFARAHIKSTPTRKNRRKKTTKRRRPRR